MFTTLNRIVLALIAIAVLAGCGQKGPLFLPGDPSAIYSAPPPQSGPTAEDEDDDDDDETPITIQQ